MTEERMQGRKANWWNGGGLFRNKDCRQHTWNAKEKIQFERKREDPKVTLSVVVVLHIININYSAENVGSFIHSKYFYSASSSPLLLRGTPGTARILCRIYTPKSHRQL